MSAASTSWLRWTGTAGWLRFWPGSRIVKHTAGVAGIQLGNLMADENVTPPPATGPLFNLQRIYLKDASLEMPNAPQIFLEQVVPQVEIQLELSNTQLADGIYEVVVRATATAKSNDKVLFLVEGKQAGIFEIRNVPAEQMEPVLAITCPNIVYPYLRTNVADLVTRTGLPTIHLAEISFESMYQQRLAQESQNAAAAPKQ
jgi:preprotein translocase subunit SecB